MSNRKHVLVFVDWYLPGFKAGGPIRSLLGLQRALHRQIRFSIVTSDRDFGDVKPYANVQANCWTTQEDGTRVFYCSPENQTAETFSRILREEKADVVYFNSLFSRNFTLLPLKLAKKINPAGRIVIAPRGMLGAGALQIKKVKKKIFLTWAKISGIYHNVMWHASSGQEKREVQAVFGNVPVRVAMNISLPELHDFRSREKEAGRLNLIFLSRISPKKNLLFAFRVLSRIGQGLIHFAIYGPVEDEVYWDECETAMINTPDNIVLEYKRELSRQDLGNAFADRHFLFFPTLHENFGHVVLESLACACPVILSDQTPWRDLEAKKIGWDLPLNDEQAFEKAILRALQMDQQAYSEWSAAAYETAVKYMNDPEQIEANLRVFD